MDMIMLLLVGIAVSINILVIKVKLENKRYADALVDGALLVALTIVFGGSFNGLITATVASSIISAYLWFSPPNLPTRTGSRTKKRNWRKSEFL